MSKVKGQKRQLEKARQERAAAKRDKRQAKAAGDVTGDEAAVDEGPADPVDQDEVLAQLADLHHRYAEGDVPLEEFEQARDELVQRLRVD